MQQPTFYAHATGTSGIHQPGKTAQRWAYTSFIVLIIALMAAGLFWVQWAAHRGLTLGYPHPSVQIAQLPSTSLQLNTPVQFSAQATGRDLNYSWDFGDQTGTVTGANPGHTYQQNGNFVVTVTVTDAIGQSSTASTSVQVYPPKPTATFTYSDYGGGYIVFDASNSHADPSTSIAQYNWDFGDGNTDNTSSYQESHTFTVEGTTYQVTLSVTDGTGQTSDSYTANVYVS